MNTCHEVSTPGAQEVHYKYKDHVTQVIQSQKIYSKMCAWTSGLLKSHVGFTTSCERTSSVQCCYTEDNKKSKRSVDSHSDQENKRDSLFSFQLSCDLQNGTGSLKLIWACEVWYRFLSRTVSKISLEQHPKNADMKTFRQTRKHVNYLSSIYVEVT